MLSAIKFNNYILFSTYKIYNIKGYEEIRNRMPPMDTFPNQMKYQKS